MLSGMTATYAACLARISHHPSTATAPWHALSGFLPHNQRVFFAKKLQKRQPAHNFFAKEW